LCQGIVIEPVKNTMALSQEQLGAWGASPCALRYAKNPQLATRNASKAPGNHIFHRPNESMPYGGAPVTNGKPV
jgi:hypothetical protein